MKETLNRIWKRFKTLSILLILLPFLAAGAAYLFQKEGPASYTSNAEIQLANLDKESSQLKFTDPEYAKTYMTSDQFLEKIEQENQDFDAAEAKSKINFVIKPAKVLGISYTGTTSDKTEKTLKVIIDQYINESKKIKEEIAEKYENAKTETSPESDKTASEYDIIILGLEEATVLKEVQLDQAQESTKNTAVFGFLIGLILSFIFLLLPEIFRK
jgi:teichuronic acid biosynthesis protein TuaF